MIVWVLGANIVECSSLLNGRFCHWFVSGNRSRFDLVLSVVGDVTGLGL